MLTIDTKTKQDQVIEKDITMSPFNKSKFSSRWFFFILNLCISSKTIYSQILIRQLCTRTIFADQCEKILKGDSRCNSTTNLYDLADGVIDLTIRHTETVSRMLLSISYESQTRKMKEAVYTCQKQYEFMNVNIVWIHNVVMERNKNAWNLLQSGAKKNINAIKFCDVTIEKSSVPWAHNITMENIAAKRYNAILKTFSIVGKI